MGNSVIKESGIDIRVEEKRLYEEYKKKLLELRKVQKEKEAVWQVFTKGLLPLYVLFILSLGETNGNDISHKIGERTNGHWIPSTGGIYPLLKKLEKEKLVVGPVKACLTSPDSNALIFLPSTATLPYKAMATGNVFLRVC